jgi:hypothetical protein
VVVVVAGTAGRPACWPGSWWPRCGRRAAALRPASARSARRAAWCGVSHGGWCVVPPLRGLKGEGPGTTGSRPWLGIDRPLRGLDGTAAQGRQPRRGDRCLAGGVSPRIEGSPLPQAPKGRPMPSRGRQPPDRGVSFPQAPKGRPMLSRGRQPPDRGVPFPQAPKGRPMPGRGRQPPDRGVPFASSPEGVAQDAKVHE